MSSVRAQRQSWPPGPLWLEGLGRLVGALRARGGASDDLDEARELLAYWEQRARRLPRWALLRRREAREMACRWRTRVREAERVRYGSGLAGAASQFAIEHRMPATVAHRGRQALRLAAFTLATFAIALTLVLAAAVALVAEAVLGAL
jgi:hypothetical protein